jgi:hypothetical protein
VESLSADKPADMGASLQRHLDWLYGPRGVYPGNVPCRCDHGYRGLGMLYGTSMGKGWVRTTTHPDCPHHGTRAEKERRERYKAEGRSR